MKKQLLTLVLLAATSVASFAQGTLNLVNSVGTPIRVDTDGNGTGDRAATAADGLKFEIFWGTSADTANTLVSTTLAIGNTAGVLASAPTVFALTGTEENQTYFVQMRASSATLIGQTRAAQMTLGPTAGPGYAVWQSASATSPLKWNPLVVTVVPEPSTIALGVLGLGSLLLFRRRK